MDWIKAYLGKNGTMGALALVLLILVAQNAGLIGTARQALGGDQRAPQAVTTEQMERHIEQTKDTHQKLDEIKEQLQRNGNTTAIGLRLLCIQSAKTDQQRSDCARIQ